MRLSKRNGTSSPGTRTAVLLGMLAVLVAFVVMAPGGPMGFLQGIAEEKDASSIAVLASLMGISFVLLHKQGLPSDEDEVETPMQ